MTVTKTMQGVVKNREGSYWRVYTKDAPLHRRDMFLRSADFRGVTPAPEIAVELRYEIGSNYGLWFAYPVTN
jgi:hypothetical protein